MPKLPPKVQKVSVAGVARRVRSENNKLVKDNAKAAKSSERLALKAAAALAGETDHTRLDGVFSTVDSFQNFALSLGMGTDNTMSASTYGFNPITRQRITLEWLHRGTWLGGMAVDLVADDMTRSGVKLNGEISPDDMEKIEEHVGALGVWENTNDGIKWGRLYGGCLLVLQIEGQKYDTPLRIETIGKGMFKGIAVLDRWMVEPSLNDLVTEAGPSQGLPKFYRVVDDAPIRITEKIHYSRCVRLGGVGLPYYQRLMENLWDESVIERLYDRLTMFDAATTGASQLIHKSFLRTLKMKGLRNALAAGGNSAKGVIAQVSTMRRFQQNEGINIIDGDDDFTIENSSGIAGMADMLGRFGEQISGALQIPLVRLFGQSPAGFSSGEADLRMYYDGIKQQQNRRLLFPMTRIYRCVAQSIGIQLPPGFSITFKPLWQLTEKEQAETAVVTTNAVNEALGAGLIKVSTGMKELRQSSDITGIFSNITEEDIAAQEKAEEQQELAEPPMTSLEELGGAGTPSSTQASAPKGSAVQPPPKAAAGAKEQEPGGKPVKFASAHASATPKAQPKAPTAPVAGKVPGETAGEANGPSLSPTMAKTPGEKLPAEETENSGEDAEAHDDMPVFDGLDYFIETRRGEVRSGNNDGTAWSVTMPAHYGYIKGTGSVEGWHEGMDCYIGDNAKAKRVFVVHQKDLKTGQLDEHKTLLGFSDAASAVDCYDKSFSDGKGKERRMKVVAYSLDGFKKWLHDNWRVQKAQA